MLKIYFDASVVIAGLISLTGGSAKLLELVKLGAIAGITSETVLDEVLSHVEKIGKSPDEIHQIIKTSRLLIRPRISSGEIVVYADKIHIEDAHLIAGAKLTKCQFLVSLDKKHVLNSMIINKFSPLKIVSPKELLEQLLHTT